MITLFKYILLALLLVWANSCRFKKTSKTNSHAKTSVASPISAEKAKASISQYLKAQKDLSIPEQIQLYKQLKKERPEDFNFENEDELTMYGYKKLWEGEPEQALALFTLIQEMFPSSANAYDSLGEVYLSLGDSAAALYYYTKAYEMNSDNFFAKDQVERILHPNQKELSLEEKFSKKYGRQAYLSDLDMLEEKLQSVHPHPFKFTSAQDFAALFESKRMAVREETTYGEFLWMCNALIAALGCSHSDLGGFYTESQMLPAHRKFPLQIRYIQNKMYVVDVLTNKDRVSVGDVVSHINGHEVRALLRTMYSHIPAQAHIATAKRYAFNAWSSDMIAYALGVPETFRIRLEGQQQNLVLQAANPKMPFAAKGLPNRSNKLDLHIQKDKATALLSIPSFNYYPWNNLEEFTSFIDQSFAEITKQQIQHLIIDVRGNGGGSAESSIYLLRHLSAKVFYYFGTGSYAGGTGEHQPISHGYAGDYYFLIDGLGESTTGHFITKVKQLQLGTIVGEELGSNQFCTAGRTILRLPATKTVYGLANTVSELVDIALPVDRGILPDNEVHASFKDYQQQKDVVLDFTNTLIQKQQ